MGVIFRREGPVEFKNVDKPPQRGVLYACPCCRYETLSERAGYDICPVCFWEDDGQDDHDADDVRGGPNDTLSLTEARKNYLEIGATEKRVVHLVRSPTDEEKRARAGSDE